MSNIDYKSKYLKYKNKYEALKSQTGGQPKIVQKSSDDNDDKNIYIDQMTPYWDLFYSNLNQNTDDDQIRYDDVQLKPQAGRIIERLVGDIIDLKVIVKKLEKKIDDHYHEVPTTGVRYFNKGQKGPIPDYQSTVEKVPVYGPKIVPVDGPNIVPVDGPKIVQGDGPKIVQGDGRTIVREDPETGKWNTTIMEVPQKKDPFLVKKDPVTGEYNVGFKSGPKIVQEEGQNEYPCPLKGGEVVSVNLDGGKNPKFGIVDYVEDGKIYAYFGDSFYPESYDCNLFDEQKISIHIEKNKQDVANEFEAPFWTDESFGRRPLALKEFIEKNQLKLPRRFKGGFVE